MLTNIAISLASISFQTLITGDTKGWVYFEAGKSKDANGLLNVPNNNQEQYCDSRIK